MAQLQDATVSGVEPKGSTPESVLNLAIHQRTNEQCWEIALSLNKLILFFINLYKIRSTNSGDYLQVGYLGVYRAARLYRPPYTKTSFNAFARRCILNAFCEAFTNEYYILVPRLKRKTEPVFKIHHHFDLDTFTDNGDMMPGLSDKQLKMLATIYGFLTDDERHIFLEFYGYDQTDAAIALSQKLKKQQITTRRWSTLRRLRRHLNMESPCTSST